MDISIILSYARPIGCSPLLSLGIAIIFEEVVLTSVRNKLLLFGLLIASTAAGTFPNPKVSPVWSYAWGLINAWAALVWGPLWIWAVDFRSSRRLHYNHGNSKAGKWLVEGQPPKMTLKRVGWSIDLLTNFRAVSWSHGIRKDSPWIKCQTLAQDTRLQTSVYQETQLDPLLLSDVSASLFQECLLRLASLSFSVGLLIMSSRQYVKNLRHPQTQSTFRSDYFIGFQYSTFMTMRAICIAICTCCMLSSIHQFFCLAYISVFFIRNSSVPPRWSLPTLFGNKFSTNVAVFWSKTWHDLFYFSLITLLRSSSPRKTPKVVGNLLRVTFGFILSGTFHAVASYAVDQQIESAIATIFIFIIQPMGIVLQLAISKAMTVMKIPMQGTRLLSAMIGFTWLVVTVNLLANTSAFDKVLHSLASISSF